MPTDKEPTPETKSALAELIGNFFTHMTQGVALAVAIGSIYWAAEVHAKLVTLTVQMNQVAIQLESRAMDTGDNRAQISDITKRLQLIENTRFKREDGDLIRAKIDLIEGRINARDSYYTKEKR